MSEVHATTWDGQPVSREKPYGATVVVFRNHTRGREYLILHRTYNPPDYEGDWAWTPPSGARHPGEAVAACAARELHEETGLTLPIVPTDTGTPEWAVFFATAPPGARVRLSVEHDRSEWLPAAVAARRCRPDLVGNAILGVERLLGEDS